MHSGLPDRPPTHKAVKRHPFWVGEAATGDLEEPATGGKEQAEADVEAGEPTGHEGKGVEEDCGVVL